MSEETGASLTEPAKLLLLAALLVNDNIISCNAKAFLKELILRRDSRLIELLERFESKETGDTTFLDQIHSLIEDESFAVYSEIFSDTSLEVGKTLSKGERDERDLNDQKSLIYGEVDYSSFYRVLRKINPAAGGTFYDLGSGTGKAVMAARLNCDFSRCLGIEILESLHNQAAMIMHRFNENFQDMLSAGMHQMAAVFEGSFLNYDWSDGDVVFANSTCFDEELMADMAAMARSLKPGAFFVTFTKGLNIPDAFELIERKRYRMSWGPATVFIHRRLKENGESVGNFKLNLLPSDEASYSDDEDNDGNDTRWSNEDVDGDSSEEEEGDDDEDDEASDDEEDENELGYEAYLRERAKFYRDFESRLNEDVSSEDDDDEDFIPSSSDDEESDDSNNMASGDEEVLRGDDDEADQDEFYSSMMMNSLRLGHANAGAGASSSKSTPPSSRGTSSRESPSMSMATPPAYHSSRTGSSSKGSASGSNKKSTPDLHLNVPSRRQQAFQESIGSPQDAALLRKKNRSRMKPPSNDIGEGY